MLKRWMAVLPVALGLAGAAQAALIDRGNGMIYDSTLNITWLKNWNQAAGSSFDNGSSTSDGRMTWASANAWAEGLNFGGFSDWRLPTMVDTGSSGCDFSYAGGTDCGFNVQTKTGSTVYSEMAHLWYESLGNKSFCPPGDATCDGYPQDGGGLTNTGPFLNMQSDYYWSGTVYAPDPAFAWVFGTLDGIQAENFQSTDVYPVAVRPGDVAAAVPEPQSVALALLALGAAAAARRRRTP